MRRWNGWGEETIDSPLSPAAITFIRNILGVGTPTRDATLDEVISQVPPSQLPTHRLISTDPEERVRHARGQSLPDWITLRRGYVDTFPDGIAYPESESEVRTLFGYALKVGAQLIPYGGGTSVVGHINVLPDDRPVLTIDLRRMSHLHNMEKTSHLATFGAGVTGLHLEAQLRADGGKAHLSRIRSICQGERNWNDTRWEQEEESYLKLVRTHYGLPDPATIPDWHKLLIAGKKKVRK